MGVQLPQVCLTAKLLFRKGEQKPIKGKRCIMKTLKFILMQAAMKHDVSTEEGMVLFREDVASVVNMAIDDGISIGKIGETLVQFDKWLRKVVN